MNEDKWNKLPKQDQDAILVGLGRGARAARRQARGTRPTRAASRRSRRPSVKIIEASPAFVADVRKRTAPLVQDWIKSANAKGVDGAKACAEFQDELKKVAAGK